MADFATLPGGLVFGTDGADLVDADRDAPGSFDNLIATFGGSDTVFAGQGNDIVFGGDEKGGDGGGGSGPPAGDYLFGEEGNDILFGGRGDDVLDGGSEDDVLIGGKGNDLLIGGDGNDFLAGNAGADTLLGGSGEDTFYFESGFGRDVVLDFRPGEDVIAIQANINDSGITSADDLVERISSDDTGAVIDLGNGDQIKLVGVSTEDLLSNLSDYVKIV